MTRTSGSTKNRAVVAIIMMRGTLACDMSWKGMAHQADWGMVSLVRGCVRWFTYKREIAHHCKTIGKSSHVRTFVGIIQGIEYVTPNAQMSPMTQKARTDLEWVLSESGWQMATYLTIGKRMK